jgi:hypothetical protein
LGAAFVAAATGGAGEAHPSTEAMPGTMLMESSSRLAVAGSRLRSSGKRVEEVPSSESLQSVSEVQVSQ